MRQQHHSETATEGGQLLTFYKHLFWTRVIHNSHARGSKRIAISLVPLPGTRMGMSNCDQPGEQYGPDTRMSPSYNQCASSFDPGSAWRQVLGGGSSCFGQFSWSFCSCAHTFAPFVYSLTCGATPRVRKAAMKAGSWYWVSAPSVISTPGACSSFLSHHFVHHRQRRRTLCRRTRATGLRCHCQTVPLLHQGVTQVARHALVSRPLLVPPRVGVRLRLDRKGGRPESAAPGGDNGTSPLAECRGHAGGIPL